MSRKAETALKANCVKAALRLGDWCEANHGNAYTRRGRSDVQGAKRGNARAFYVELKMPGELPEPEQAGYLISIMRRCPRALVGYATSVEEFLTVIDEGIAGSETRRVQLDTLIEISRKPVKRPAKPEQYRAPQIALDSLDRTL